MYIRKYKTVKVIECLFVKRFRVEQLFWSWVWSAESFLLMARRPCRKVKFLFFYLTFIKVKYWRTTVVLIYKHDHEDAEGFFQRPLVPYTVCNGSWSFWSSLHICGFEPVSQLPSQGSKPSAALQCGSIEHQHSGSPTLHSLSRLNK